MTGRNDNENLLERAGAWHARLRADDAGGADHGAFAAWLAADPRHRLAYADVCAASYALEQAGAAVPSARAVTQRAPASPWLATFAGAGLAFVAVLGFWFGAAPWQDATSDAWTAAGEQRTLTMSDGSRIVLDGDSAVDFAYEDGARTVVLKRGAAYVDVVRDPARPFTVVAGETRATALGTRYAVERTGARVTVAVEHGLVEVRSEAAPEIARRVAAGDAVAVSEGQAPDDALADASSLAWTKQRLVFSATPLEDALARLDRHVPGRIVLVRDPGDARVTAAIAATDAAGGLAAIAREHGLALRRVPALGYLVY